MHALSGRGARDPLEVVEDEGQRALLAEALLGEKESPSEAVVAGAITSLEQRQIEGRLRELRGQIAEAERRGDFAEVAVLAQKKLELDKALRLLRGARAAGG